MTDPQLPGFLHSIQPYLKHYGYAAVATIVGIESFGPPLPGETILIAAAIYAGAGSLNVYGVFAVGFLAAVVGDNIAYAGGRFGGRRVVERYGKYVGATEERFAKAEKFFVRFGGRIVIVARFIEGLRQLNGWISGITGMHWLRFFLCNALGAALWVGLWTTVGYEAGGHIQAIYDGGRYVAIALIALALIAIGGYVLRRRRRGPPDPAAPDGEVTVTGR